MMYTQMDIDLDVIAENYKKVSDRLPEETGIIAVVKADAYGLGGCPHSKKTGESRLSHVCSHFYGRSCKAERGWN